MLSAVCRAQRTLSYPEASEGEAVVASILVLWEGPGEAAVFDSLHSKDLSQPRLDQGFPEPHVSHRIEPAGFLKPHLGQPVGGRGGGILSAQPKGIPVHSRE